MANLVLIDGDRPHRVFPVGDQLTIGRDWSNDVQLLDVKVSRNHARLLRVERRYFIQDLKSHNGTFVNDAAVQEHELGPGDRIRIGDNVLVFEEQLSSPIPKGSGAAPDTGVGTTTADDTGHTVTFTLHGDLRADFLEDRSQDRDQDKLRRATRDLKTLFAISNVLNTERDRGAIFEQIADRIAEVMRAESVLLLELIDADGQLLPVTRTTRTTIEDSSQIPKPSNAIVREVLKDKQSALIHDAVTDQRFSHSESVVINRLRSVMCVPIRSSDDILGLIYVSNDAEAGVFTRYDLQLLTAIGIEAGIALENRTLFEDLEQLFLATIEALAATIDAKDGYTAGHSRRVADNAVAVALEMDLTEQQRKDIFVGGILHDIGKIGIPDRVLNLPGRFGPEQRECMERHPVVGADILKPIPRMRRVADIVRHHHEWYNGEGYPDGIGGEEIPLLARIVAVSDSFDAITSTRVYRAGKPVPLARDIIRMAAGTQFDPQVVRGFLRALAADRIRIADNLQD